MKETILTLLISSTVLLAACSGPLTAEAAQRIFERIIDEMRTVQKIRMEQKATAEAADPEE